MVCFSKLIGYDGFLFVSINPSCKTLIDMYIIKQKSTIDLFVSNCGLCITNAVHSLGSITPFFGPLVLF